MRNNYLSLKCYNSYFLVNEIIFKINVYLNTQTFHGRIYMKAKNHKQMFLSNLKNIIFSNIILYIKYFSYR